jgi:hypothetical protein
MSMNDQGNQSDDRVRLCMWMARDLKERVDSYRRQYSVSMTGAVSLLVASALDGRETRSELTKA